MVYYVFIYFYKLIPRLVNCFRILISYLVKITESGESHRILFLSICVYLK